jgi:hypothetical protein
MGYHPLPPIVRTGHVFCYLFSRCRLQTHPRFRFLVRPRAAGRPSRPPGAGLENSETALQDAHRRRAAALQVRRRPLLHNPVSTIPAGLVPNHRRRRKRQTVAEAQNLPQHRDDGPPCVRQGPPPGPGQAEQGGSGVPRAGGGGHHPPFRFAMVVAAAHGPQEGRVMAATTADSTWRRHTTATPSPASSTSPTSCTAASSSPA